MNLRWTKRLAALLRFHASQTQPAEEPSSEAEEPSSEAEAPSSEGVRCERQYLCAGCRAKRKNPQQVRAGRARARNARRDERGRYLRQ